MDGLASPDPIGAWPGGHRAALVILASVATATAEPGSVATEPGIDYTATGLQHLLDLLEDFDLPVTTVWSEAAVNVLPQLLRRIGEAGHEIAASFAVDGAISSVAPLIGALRRVSGTPVVGAAAFDGTVKAGDSGFAWLLTGESGDLPSIIGGSNELSATVHVPVSPYWIDRTWLHPARPLPPSSLLEEWSAGLAAVRTQGYLMTVVIHPHIIMRPGHAAVFSRFLDEAVAAGDVWITRADQLALWWRQRQLDS